MDSTQTEVKAMEDMRDKIEEVFSDDLAFSYSQFYLGWETNKVLNVLCVQIVTLWLGLGRSKPNEGCLG